jgi:transglutaminase-like putative cysteine protease
MAEDRRLGTEQQWAGADLTASTDRLYASPFEELPSLLPLYAAALVVTICGIAAVNMTVDDSSFSSLTVMLTAVGFGVSLALRLMRVDPNQAMYPLLGIALFVTLQRLLSGEGMADFVFGAGVRGGGGAMQPDVVLASLLSWLVVLRSFALLTNYSLLFCAVPTIAMLGLTGSSQPDTEIVVYFFIFLLATIFMVGYEHHLRLQEVTIIPRDDDRPSVRSHASTALALFVAVGGVGGALTLAARPVLSRLSPFATPMLRSRQSFPTFNNALQNNSTYVPIGSGPISLSETPLFEVRGARNSSLWRTRTYDYYTGRGWTSTMAEDQRSPVANAEVSFTPPDVEGVEREERYYRIDFEPDPFRPASLPTELVTQQIVLLSDMLPYLPLPGRPKSLISRLGEVSSDTAGVVNARTPLSRGTAYQITADTWSPLPRLLRQAPPVNPSRFYRPEYLALPLGTERVQSLAHRLAAGRLNAYDKAIAMEAYIEKNCPYTLTEEATPAETDAVDYYLFSAKEGACDLAASAMAILCRSVGIPARWAAGYLEGVEDPSSGGRVLREADSHAWVELYFPGYGWVAFNPAPQSPAGTTDVSGQVVRSARRLWRGVERRGIAAFFTLGLTLVFLGMAVKPGFDLWWSTLRERRMATARARSGDTTAVLALRYRELTDALARAGWDRAPTETPTAFLARLRSELPEDPAAVLESAEFVTIAFIQARYAENPVSADMVADVTRRVREMRRALRAVKG